MRKLTLSILILAVIHLGATQSEKKNSGSLNPVSVGDSVVRFLGQKKDNKPTQSQQKNSAQTTGVGVARPNNLSVAKTATVSAKLSEPSVAMRPRPPLAKTALKFESPTKSLAYVNPRFVAPAVVNTATADTQVRQEIQRIIDLNKQIKQLQLIKVAQFERIQELAQQRQIALANVGGKGSEKKSNSPNSKLNQASLLSQEKLRVIHETAQNSSKTLNTTTEKNATASSKKTAG